MKFVIFVLSWSGSCNPAYPRSNAHENGFVCQLAGQTLEKGLCAA